MSKRKKVRLFCSDLDGTLLGNPEECARFVKEWEALGNEVPVLVYSTGRLDADAKLMIRKNGMPEPDFYTTGVGTMIFDTRAGMMMEGFAELLDECWDVEKVTSLMAEVSGIGRQPEEQQHAWKSSWFWRKKSAREIDCVRAMLADSGISAQVIYSTSLDLDVLPSAANKGNAVKWLASYLDIKTDEVLVAGDSGNDSSMFKIPDVMGIVPQNASPELLEEIRGCEVYLAQSDRTTGVIEGLSYFGVFTGPEGRKEGGNL